MTRLAADSSHYLFSLVDRGTGKGTDHGFVLPSVTSIISDVLGKPASAMAWWGYRLATQGVNDLIARGVDVANQETDVEAILRSQGIDPNQNLTRAGSRGTKAHYILECLAEGRKEEADELVVKEVEAGGALYGRAVWDWWESRNAWRDQEVLSERPVWSLRNGYVGTLDLAATKGDSFVVMDLKTHKPASGFTKPGGGPAYLADLVQIRAYRSAFEEMGLGDTCGSRVIIARENGTWLEDDREVPNELWLSILEAYRLKQAFEDAP